MKKSEVIQFLLLRTLGNFFLLFSIFGIVATFGPSLYYEIQFRIAQARGVHYTIAEPDLNPLGQVIVHADAEGRAAGGLAAALAGPKEQILVPKDSNFTILIPKLGANANVIPNVDPRNEKTFLPALQKGVAHAQGSVFPGQAGNIYLFAHSTDNFWDVGRYNALFYLLKDLNVGDEVVLFFENRRYNYVVNDTKIVDPSDVSYLMKSQQSGQETLILQTCWPPGTTWKRLLVIAKPR